MAEPPKRRIFKLLRRTAKTVQGASGRSAEEESALWNAHGRALAGTHDTADAAQRIASSLAKQRAAVDAAQDRARAMSARAQEITASTTKIGELFERLGLVALNAGLEGARLGEGPGRSLTLVAEEVRDHASRGVDGARELGTALAECVAELGQIASQVDKVREASSDATQEAARAAGLAVDGERALVEMGERMRKTTGSDPETARSIAQATEHARALVLALSQVSGKVPRAIVVGALRPVLEPLARLLEGDESADADE
jgi:methyl-accepting chemotaxis protein